MLVAKHMPAIPFDIESVQQYEKWHNVIIDCSLVAGGSVIYNNGTCKRFDPKHNRIIHYGYKQRRKHVNVKPWWDKECQEAVDARRSCYKEFLKCPNKWRLSQYRKASQTARNVIKVRKKANFNKFIDELDPCNNPRNFWKVVKIFRNSVVFNSDHSPTSSKLNLINRYIDCFAPSGASQKLPDLIPSQFPSFFNLQFQAGELMELVVRARENSSPGNDLICYSLLKLLPPIAFEVLLKIFYNILRESSFPLG